MTDTKTTAKLAAKEDAKQTGPAGLPNTAPAPGSRPRLPPAEKAKRDAAQLNSRFDTLEYRTTQLCKLLTKMGTSSLAGLITRYTDIPDASCEEAVRQVRTELEAVEAALLARRGARPVSTAFKVNLRAVNGQPPQ